MFKCVWFAVCVSAGTGVGMCFVGVCLRVCLFVYLCMQVFWFKRVSM